MTSGGAGEEIGGVQSQVKYLSECYDNCDESFGIGFPLSTDPHGTVAVPLNRLLADPHDRAVVYRPVDGYIGPDSFQYRTLVGVTPSTAATVDLSVRKCRLSIEPECSQEYSDDKVKLRRDD